MTESKVFKLPEGIDASAVGKEVENFLRGTKNLVTEGAKTPDGYFVQAKEQEGRSWKKLAGTTLATQVQIIQINDTITVNIGNGEWSDKIGAGVVGAFIFLEYISKMYLRIKIIIYHVILPFFIFHYRILIS